MRVTASAPDVGMIIGREGRTIDALQHVVSSIAYRRQGPDGKAVEVDAGGYRERRRSRLEATAREAAERAVRGGAPVRLEPMSAPERRVVHLALQETGAWRPRARATTLSDTWSSCRPLSERPRPEPWLDALLETPGLTSIADRGEAYRVHVEGDARAFTARRPFRRAARRRRVGRRLARHPPRSCAARPRGHFARGQREEGRLPRASRPRLSECPRDPRRAEEQEVDAYGVAVARALAPRRRPPNGVSARPEGRRRRVTWGDGGPRSRDPCRGEGRRRRADARWRRNRHSQGCADTAGVPAPARNGPQASSIVLPPSEDN